jgi:hypothetical protein
MISGSNGTKRKATENPRKPIPARVKPSVSGKPNIFEGPKRKRESAQKMKAMQVI